MARQKPLSLLKISKENPRYFMDASGRAVYLTGSHTWNNLVDRGETDPPPQFDWKGYLDFMQKHNHNFMRIWRTEHQLVERKGGEIHSIFPFPWQRTGPGTALDGKPKFDLTLFNREYFDRMRRRIQEAGEKGIYVSIMLFEGCRLQKNPNAWPGHPFHKENNANGLNGDKTGQDNGLVIQRLEDKEVLGYQEAYVRQVIDTVNDLDNVLYEICNESFIESKLWQYHLIRFIKEYEKGKAKQHPVGMSALMTQDKAFGDDQDLYDSPADWIAPCGNLKRSPYVANPPAADGRKVVMLDTDHFWGLGGNGVWVWKTFCRGLNPIYMDDPFGDPEKWKDFVGWYDVESARKAMGQTRAYAEKINLARMVPANDRSSTGYCLADPENECLVFQPDGGPFHVKMEDSPKGYSAEWFSPQSGECLKKKIEKANIRFVPPFPGPVVLILKKKQ